MNGREENNLYKPIKNANKFIRKPSTQIGTSQNTFVGHKSRSGKSSPNLMMGRTKIDTQGGVKMGQKR